MRPKILLVDPDSGAAGVLAATLRRTGLAVRTSVRADAAIATARREHLDGLIVEVELPTLDGIELLHLLRVGGTTAPCLFVSARGDLDDKLRGLTAGGDDYITKPYLADEVAARVHAVLRRTRHGEPRAGHALLAVDDLSLDQDSYEVLRAGRPVGLSPLEFKLLRYLMINAGRVVSKPQILAHLWSEDFRDDATVVESYVCSLRRKVANRERPLIHTVRGYGYLLCDNRFRYGRLTSPGAARRSTPVP